jgi:broad specificity phosphatase PhoE
MPHLYLVRHGQPDFTGDYDSLTALGAEQSSWLGQHFAARGLRFARAVSGTLRRQTDTCDRILAQLRDGPAPLRDARFNEYDHGSLLAFFAGDRLQKLRADGDRRGYFTAIRDALQSWTRHEGPIVDGESWVEFGGRIEAGVATLCDGLQRDDNVLLVTSGGVIGRYTSAVLDAGPDAAIQLNLQTRNTGVTEIVRSSGADARARVVSFNAIAHLERPDRAHAVTYS